MKEMSRPHAPANDVESSGDDIRARNRTWLKTALLLVTVLIAIALLGIHLPPRYWRF